MKNNIKKYLTMGLSLILVAAVSILGTIAYLTDTDSKLNTFTVGNIDIALKENVGVVGEGATVTETDDGAVYTGAMPGDYLKKEVTVTNDGNNAAYVAVTVTLNNALKINNAIDAVYEEGYTADQIQAIYDNVFVGWGINYNPRPADGGISATGEKNARGVIDGSFGLPEKVLKVDFAKTTDVSNDTYMIDTSNWFKTEQENNGNYGGFYPASKGYYTADMNDYEIKYTYYMLLEKGESTTLFKGLNVPEVFNKEQLAMFDGLKIDVKAAAIQADNFYGDAKAAFTALKTELADGVNDGDAGSFLAPVSTADELQTAIDNAKDGDTIILGADIEGDVTVTQKAGVKFTINGNGKTIDGSIIVDGKSKRYETAGVTIKNIKFSSDNAAPAAYINLGVSGDTNTRYTNNVTVSNCTFDYSGTGDKAAIKSYTGGDYNLTAEGCTVNAGMHSFMQVTNIEKGLMITGCKVYSKNGINLNYTPYLNMSDCEFDTKGYCVRFGVNNSTNNGNFTIANSTLKSANDDGDAVIIFRGTMTGATLNIKGTTLAGTPDITGTANIVR